MAEHYGPERPEDPNSFTDTPVKVQLTGIAKKLSDDFERRYRLVEGTEIVVFRVDTTTNARCTRCTNIITGQVTISDCSECGGTGYTANYVEIGTYWAKIDILPETRYATAMGNTDNQGVRRTTFSVVKAPLLQDQDLLVTRTTRRVYKVVDQAPELIAIQGAVILQNTGASLITSGSKEYTLITW